MPQPDLTTIPAWIFDPQAPERAYLPRIRADYFELQDLEAQSLLPERHPETPTRPSFRSHLKDNVIPLSITGGGLLLALIIALSKIGKASNKQA